MLTPNDIHLIVGIFCQISTLENVSIILGDMIYDVASKNERDMDITISYKNEKGEETSFVGLEVKGETRPLDSAKVEQLCRKFQDMKPIKRGGIVSASGYTKPAIRKAKYHNIELYEFKDWEFGTNQFPIIPSQNDFKFKEELNEWINTPNFTYFFYEESNENDLNDFCIDSEVLINSDRPLKDKIKKIGQLNNYLFTQVSKMPEFRSQLKNKDIEEEVSINLNVHLSDRPFIVVLGEKQLTVKMVNINGIVKKTLKDRKSTLKMLVKHDDESYRIGSAICELSDGMLVGVAISTTKDVNSVNLIHIPVPERLKKKIYRQKIK